MASGARIVHGIHTNAAGDDGHGYRDLWVGEPAWPAGDLRRARDWLRGLRPERAHGTDLTHGGLATTCHRLGGRVHAVMGAVEAAWVADEHGRGGMLVHVMWAALDESRPAPDFGRSLLDLRHRFQVLAEDLPALDNVRRLAAYLEHCAGSVDVEMRDPDPASALACGRSRCLAVLSLAAMNGLPQEIPWPDDGDPPSELIRTAALLPPRLRLALSWTFRLRQSAQASPTVREKPASRWQAPSERGAAGHVLGRIEEHLDRGPSERLAGICADWRVTSWRHFEQEIMA